MRNEHTIKNTFQSFAIGEHKSARRHKTSTPTGSAAEQALDPRILAAIHESIGAETSKLADAIKASSNANSDLSAGLVIRGEQARKGSQVGYDNPDNNRVPFGMFWASGQNSTYSAGQMPGMTTPFREVYVARPVPAGNKANSGGAAWYQAKVPIESCPPGTVYTTGDGTTEYIDEDGNSQIIPVEHLGAAGEIIQMGQLNYKLLREHLERRAFRDPNNVDTTTTPHQLKKEAIDKINGQMKDYGADDAISDKSISFPWMRMMGNGLGRPEPFQPNFYAIRYKKDDFFHYKNGKDEIIKISLQEDPVTLIKTPVYDDVNGADHFGFVRTNRSFIREQVEEGGKTVWKFRRNGQLNADPKKNIGADGKQLPTDGFLATDGLEYEDGINSTGKAVHKFYMADPNRFDEPMICKDKDGNEHLVEITDKRIQPQVEIEGITARDGKIIDPRTLMLDNAAPQFGFKKESISMENVRRVWSFKRTLMVDTTKSLEEQKEQVNNLPQELKKLITPAEGKSDVFGFKKQVGHNVALGQLVVEVDKGGKKVKYRIVQERDYDAIRTFENGNVSLAGQPPSQFYAYELDDQGLPIPEIKLPEIGMLTDLKNHPDNPLVRDSMYQHFTGNYQPGLDGKQSDGSAQISRGMYWHGRAIDRNRARHMLTYLDEIKSDNSVGGLIARSLFTLGYDTKKDFLPNTRFAVREFGENSPLYQKMREASEHDIRAGKDGTHTDNQVAIWYEYGFSRCISDFVNGTNRAFEGVKEATAAGIIGSGLAGMSCLALGMTAAPAAAVFASAFVVTGYLWNSTTYQHSRRRKDTVTIEELESHADTSLIYGQYGNNTKSSEVLLYNRDKKMSVFNTVGIQNDVYVALRGLFGAIYLWNGAYMGIDKMQEKAGQYAAGAAAAGVITTAAAATGFGFTSATAAVTTAALTVSGVGLAATLTLGTVAGLYYLGRYMAAEGKSFGEHAKEEFAVLKPKYYNWKALTPEDIKGHKDTFQRVGFSKRIKESRYTLSVAGHSVGE